jgi:hypothetical protein
MNITFAFVTKIATNSWYQAKYKNLNVGYLIS